MWYKWLVYYCFLLTLSLLVCGGCVSKADYETLQKENESLKSEVAQLQLDNGNLTIEFARIFKELNLYKDTFGEVHENIQPAYKGGSGEEPMQIHNNPNASNPTWRQLVSFLDSDTTEKLRYWDLELGFAYTLDTLKKLGVAEGESPEYFVCTDFANLLHDNAEAIGIRAAVVGVFFEGKDDGHVLNAFVTTDRGLVYIDCTGNESCTGIDKVDYIAKDKEVGAVELKDDIPLGYEWFLQQKTLLNEYNLEVEKFNAEIKDKAYIVGTLEYKEIKAWEERLIELEKQLIPILGKEGIVTRVEIYW
jgi:hypothetical protein